MLGSLYENKAWVILSCTGAVLYYTAAGKTMTTAAGQQRVGTVPYPGHLSHCWELDPWSFGCTSNLNTLTVSPWLLTGGYMSVVNGPSSTAHAPVDVLWVGGVGDGPVVRVQHGAELGWLGLSPAPAAALALTRVEVLQDANGTQHNRGGQRKAASWQLQLYLFQHETAHNGKYYIN